MIFVIATFKTPLKDRDELLAASRPCIEATRKEDGCLSYDLHQSVSDPDQVVFVERWRDREALELHFQSAHLAAWKRAAGPLIVDRSVEIIAPDKVETL